MPDNVPAGSSSLIFTAGGHCRTFHTDLIMARILHVVCAAVVATSAITASAITASAQTKGPAGPATTTVKGTVYDSLTMSPSAKATVWLSGGTQTAVTDENGRFELESVPIGKHFLAFSSVALDSLGLEPLGTQVEIDDRGKAVRLATPSFATIWKSLCANVTVASAADSGIVWGTIRDAASDSRLHGAAAHFTWYDAHATQDNKGLSFNELNHRVTTDSTGNYYACGLPSDIKISSQATGTRSASGDVEFLIGERRVSRIDLLVSSDMVLQATAGQILAADSTIAMTPKGTAILKGRVIDAKGKPANNATITAANADSVVRTNADGEFVFLNLPAGSQSVQARMIGYSATAALVELRPAQTTSVELRLPDAQTLATVNVRSERTLGTDQVRFNERKRLEFGMTRTAKDFVGRFDVISMVRDFPRVVTSPLRGGIIQLDHPMHGRCTPATYLDGIKVDQEEITMRRPSHFAAVEVYNSPLKIPLGFDGNGCGTLLFWTKGNPRW